MVWATATSANDTAEKRITSINHKHLTAEATQLNAPLPLSPALSLGEMVRGNNFAAIMLMAQSQSRQFDRPIEAIREVGCARIDQIKRIGRSHIRAQVDPVNEVRRGLQIIGLPGRT